MKSYAALVRAYVGDGQEANLAAIANLRDVLDEQDVPLEDLVAAHEAAMLDLIDLIKPETIREVLVRVSACLSELLIAYSFADHRKKAVREHEERLDRERQRLEALGQMAGSVAHEFNNLLQPIMGMAELALEDAAAGSELAGQLKIIQDCSHQASNVVRGVLTAARAQSPTPQRVQFSLMLKRVVRFIAQITPGDLAIGLVIDCGLETVLCEEGELSQVLLNLVRNASDAMSGTGAIQISLKSHDGNGLSAVPAHLALAIADRGCGMPPGVAARAFQPFFTTKTPGQGTGLGLPVVMSIVHGWNASISIDTAPGEGTRVTILLPIVS